MWDLTLAICHADSFDGIVYVGMVMFPLLCFVGFGGLAFPVLNKVMAAKHKRSMVVLEYESLLESRGAINVDSSDSQDDSDMYR